MNLIFLHNINSSKRLKIGVTLFVVSIILVITLPVKIPYTVTATGKVFPAQKWVISRDADGQLASSVIDFKSGVNKEYSVTQFAREGVMKFTLGSLDKQHITKGDTIGSIYSSETEEQLAELGTALAIAEAALEVSISGEKEALVVEAEKKLEYAKTESAEQHKVLSRLEKLRNRDLISLEEYELAENRTELLAIQIDIAQTQLDAARSGDRPEETNLIKSQIYGLRNEIDIIQNRRKSFSIISPISGIVSKSYSSDTILTVYDTSIYIIIVPIKRDDYTNVSIGQNVTMKSYKFQEDVIGKITEIDNKIHILGDKETVFAVAYFEHSSQETLQGMLAKCVIACRPITPREYLRRILNSLVT